MVTPFTLTQLQALPPVLDIETAGRVLLVGRTKSHELARRGQFPVPVLRLGKAYRVPTAPLLALLGITPTPDGGPDLRITDPINPPTPQVNDGDGHNWSQDRRTA